MTSRIARTIVKPTVRNALLPILTVFAAGCGSSSGGGPTAPGPTATGGNVNKGPVAGAEVRVHAFTASGAPGASVAGPFVTSTGGEWSGSIPAGQGGPFLLAASGGSYVDEATGQIVHIPSGRTLHGLHSGTSSQVTPFTHAMWLGVQAQVATGVALASAIPNAIGGATDAFGFDFTATVPSAAPAASTASKQYAALLGGVSTLLDGNAALAAFADTRTMDLVIALARDMSDGRLDGLDAAGVTIEVPTDTTGSATAPFPALSPGDLSALLDAANAYAASQPALSGITFNSSQAWNPSIGPCVLTFGGPGATLLSRTCFFVSMSIEDGTPDLRVLIWEDAAASVRIQVYELNGAQHIVYVSKHEDLNTIDWNFHNGANQIPGVALNPNGSVSFSNVSLSALSASLGPLTLNGTLPKPPAAP